MPHVQDARLTSSVHDAPAAMATAVALLSADDLAALTHLLQKGKRKLPPPSFALAPIVPLPPWQRVVVSTIKRIEYDEEDQRQASTAQAKLAKEVTKYHADAHAREERTRRQQREARAQLGSRLAVATRRYWARRGEAFQQVLRVEFDVLKRHRDKRKQEDLLRETEELTKKLLESIISDKPKDTRVLQLDSSNGEGREAGSPSSPSSPSTTSVEESFRQTGKDGSVAIEASLALLDTEGGVRPLRHYQRSALHWMIHLFENKLNGILADEMGLGKTVQTIALLCYYAQYKNDWGPHLIVVPTTVVLNWKAELLRWAPGLKVLTYLGSAKERHRLRQGWTSEDAFHVCVTSYHLIVQDRRVFRHRAWGFLVLDEAHQMKNFMGKKWQSLFDLQAEYRLLLTGTPLQNSIMELWSLFHFLLPFASAFRSNDEFKEWFSNPMDDMITGRSGLNEDIVRRLQALIRPFMLRRLKKDVETQLPTKTEREISCDLSRRQRALYDDYMQFAKNQRRASGGGGGGGAGGLLSVLLGLRKVCDHPDLFEERPTISPFILGYADCISIAVPRRVLLRRNDYRGRYRFPTFLSSLDVVDLNADKGTRNEEFVSPRPNEADPSFDWLPCWWTRLRFHTGNADALSLAASPQWNETSSSWSERFSTSHFGKDAALDSLNRVLGKAQAQLHGLRTTAANGDVATAGFLSAFQLLQSGAANACVAIREGFSLATAIQEARHREAACSSVCFPLPRCAMFHGELREAKLFMLTPELCPTVAQRAAAALPIIQQVVMVVPKAATTAPPRLHWSLPVAQEEPFVPLTRESLAPLVGSVAKTMEAMQQGREWCGHTFDGSFFLRELWPVHVRGCFSFPDKRLIIHDCGKLQFLSTELLKLRQEGHRVLIFTQFVQMLTILERFLALIGVSYFRLDGSTRAEVRQAMVDRFNEDPRVTCMILSTRSGGIGLNLTGADTVIFYDSDWNPTMDLQAQDRCHRIGQTRPVTIYRLISANTVEEKILEKARERKKLNNVVIRGGQFHTIAGVGEEYEDTAAAFAALSDPVDLRSFFHDYDEDVTLPTTSAASSGDGALTSAEDILAAMRNVEDEEDRVAGAQLEQELQQRETEEAAEREEGEDDDNGDDDTLNEVGDAAKKKRKLTSLPAEKVTSISVPGEARKDALDRQLVTLEEVLTARNINGAAGGGHAELVEGGLMPAVRKRQRELLSKANKSPLDRLLTAQYGVCHEDDAWRSYDKLCDDFESHLIDLDEGVEEEEEADRRLALERAFPPFRPRLEL